MTTTWDMTDRIAVVTGGSRGIGREVVLAFAQAGADVVIASRKFDACAAVAREVTENTSRRALPVACHVGRWSEVEALAERAYAEFGRVDVLVNNAGMSPLYPDLGSVSEELWDKVLAVNLKGPFRLTTIIASRMAGGAGGAIVNISSLASIRPTGHELPYAAAKAGLDALTVGFAEAYGPKVRVNSVLPGPILTDIAAHWDAEAFADQAQQLALGRGGQPEEIVGAVMYLVSDAASYTTGAMLRVDGGAR